MKTRPPRSRRRRALLIGAILLLTSIVYIASFSILKAVSFGEETFSSTATGGHSRPLDVYLDVIAIDPVRESIDIRLDVATGPGPHGTHYDGVFDRNVLLNVSDGDTDQEFSFRENGAPTSRLFLAGMQGAIGHYPFDRYITRLVLSAQQPVHGNRRISIPIRVAVWEGMPAWVLDTARARKFERPGELGLAFAVHRPAPQIFFACVLYGIMVLIAASALAIGTLIFVGIRPVEATLVSALSAMVFALPVVRNLVPGAPPLGILADIFILLWAELAVALGLILIVTSWAQRGAK